MGSDHSDSGENFRREDWEEVERDELATTWQNRRDPTQRIEEYQLHLASQEECKREQEVYYLRKNHPQLVAALYLCSDSTSDFCASSYQERLFLEKTPIRLADIEHIPYPDFLHLYSQALRGFAELARHFGPFPVEEEYVGVNERGVAKVWANADFSSHHTVGKASQQDMVHSIVDIIERNIDQSQLPQRVPSVRNYLYRTQPKLQFQEAIAELSNFVQEFGNGYVPQKLECIDRVGGIYAIANRDKTLQATSINEYAVSTPLPAQYAVGNEPHRPQLVDSAILSSQFHQSAPRVQNGPIYVPPPPPTVLSYGAPNDERSVLTPSTVRENVPIVRRQAATFYNFTTVPSQPELVRFEPARTAPVFTFPQPLLSFPEPVIVKVGGRPNEAKLRQNEGSQLPPNGVPNGYQPQESFVQNSTSNIANNLIYQVRNEGKPTITSNEPAILNSQFFQQLNLQNNGNFPQFTSNPSISQIAPPPQTISTVSVNNNAANSQVVSNNVIRPPQQALSTDNYAFNALNAIRNEKAPIIATPPENIPVFNFLAQDKYSPQPINPSLNFTKSSQAQYAVDVNDGKSSLDFFKKLNEINNFTLPSQSQHQEHQYQSFGNIEPQRQEYHNPFAFTETSQSYQLQNGKPSEEQQFGRNAVSNIVTQHPTYEAGPDRISEPLRFENNIDMKYSIFEEANPQPTYAYRSYETSYDPDLLADLNRQRQ